MTEVEIGLAILNRRALLRLTQEQVAELVGVHRETISAIEKGGKQRGVNLATLLAVTKVLGLDVTIGERAR